MSRPLAGIIPQIEVLLAEHRKDGFNDAIQAPLATSGFAHFEHTGEAPEFRLVGDG